MRIALRIISLCWIAACVAALALPAWAGDCSGPSDCSSIPDNGTKGAAIGATVMGIFLYVRTKRKKENDPGQGEGWDKEDLVLKGDVPSVQDGSSGSTERK